MTNRWTVTFSREQLDAMWAKIDIDAIIARVVSGEYDDVSAARIRELEALVESYAATNEAQRKRIDELLGKLAEANRRAAEMDARCFELAKRLLAAAERDMQREQKQEVGE